MVTKIPRKPTTLVDDEGVPVSVDAPLPVTVVGAEGDLNLTGDVIVDTLGGLDDAAVTDPDAASATVPALLRGILAELQAQTTLLTTLSGLLDDIKTNTTPTP